MSNNIKSKFCHSSYVRIGRFLKNAGYTNTSTPGKSFIISLFENNYVTGLSCKYVPSSKQLSNDEKIEEIIKILFKGKIPKEIIKTGRQSQREKNKNRINSAEFLRSYEWRKLRMQALEKYGNRCMCCGAGPKDGVTINVDHIKPRKHYPELALDINNLQILCNPCNHGKSNWSETDWRQV